MTEAFSSIYGRYGSWRGKLFGPAVASSTYLRAFHLLLMFPLGLAYFVVLVVGLAVGGALIWAIVGPVVLIVTLYLTRWAGDAEAWMVRHVAQIELRRPPTAIETGQSVRAQLWTRLIDPTTWTGLVYLFAQFPVGIATFVCLVVGVSLSISMTLGPIAVGVFGAEFDFGPNALLVDTLPEGFIVIPIGLLAFLVTVHLVNIASALHALWARVMLASRAVNIPTLPVEVEPMPPSPEGGPGTPVEAPPLAPVEEVPAVAELTRREQEVLGLIARGYSNAEIAEAFVVSEGTVKTHVKRLLAKLNLRDRTQAASFAYEIGFVKPGEAVSEDAPTPITARRRVR